MDLRRQTGRRSMARGTSMLEMVIVLPFLLLLLFALVEFGILFGRFLALNNAAREGAREAIVFRANCDPAAVENDVVTTVQSYASTLGVTVPTENIDVNGLCTGPGADSTVTVNLPFTFEVLSGIAPSIGPTWDLSATTVMRNEG